MRFLRWLVVHRRIELIVLAVGVVMRLSMIWNYAAPWSYDSEAHWEVVQWIVKHGIVPPPEAAFEAFHPPLWYLIAAWIVKHGGTRSDLVSISIASGIIRLIVIWAIFELFLPRLRWARVVALVLGALTSISVQLDGMVYHEALNGLFGAVAILLLGLAARNPNRRRWPLAIVLGLDIGLSMLTKASGIVLLASAGVVALFELMFIDRPWRDRLRNVQPWIATAVIAVTVSGWYYARNIREYDKPFVTSFDLPSQTGNVVETNKLPMVDRRTIGYAFGWDTGLYLFPYGIRYVGSHPRFFAVSVASSFVDFWPQNFHGYERLAFRHKPDDGPGDREPYLLAGILSVIGGHIIFAATLLAWFVVTGLAVKRRDAAMLGLMVVPLMATAATMHFSTTFPVDGLGILKGAYLNFAAPSLYALFGICVAWARSSWHRWPILVILLAALYLIAAYTIYHRLHIPLLPPT
jgi:hypothetical protein